MRQVSVSYNAGNLQANAIVISQTTAIAGLSEKSRNNKPQS
ncbi:MAG: hypothetical protein AAGE96_13920 [Cyanobacteria bacterium P01_G01_bin.19]